MGKYITLGLKHNKYQYRQVITAEVYSMLHKKTEKKLVYVLHFCAPIQKNDKHADQQQYGADVKAIEKNLREYIKKTLYNLYRTTQPTLNYNKYILIYQQALQGQKDTISMYPTLDLYLSFDNNNKDIYKTFKDKSEELKPILNNLIEEWLNIIQYYDFMLLPNNNRREKISASNKQRNNAQYIKKKPLSEYTEEELAERKQRKKEYTQQYYQQHKKEFQERNQQYYKSQSPEERKEYQKQYRLKKKLQESENNN